MNRSFHLILAAETISAAGSQITIVALPLTAILALHATPFDMGLLNGAGPLAGVLAGLIAGAAIDPLPKRGILIAANAANALILAIVPLGEAGHFLSIPLLLAGSFVATGIATAEGMALISYLAQIVPKPDLAKANGRYAAAVSLTAIVGPAIAGVLVVTLTAPGAMAFDAASFLAAVLLMTALPRATPAQPDAAPPSSVRSRLSAGFGYIAGNPTMRRIVIIAAALNIFGAAFASMQALFIVQRLHVPPGWFGAGLAVGGGGAVAGSMLSGWFAKKLDLVTLLAFAILLFVVADGITSLLFGAPSHIAIGFAACRALDSFGNALIGVALLTYIQREAPAELLARVGGALMTAMSAPVPLGALAGGALGTTIGVRHTLMAATLGYAAVLAGVWRYRRR
jgi:MFS family permease